MFLVTYPNNRTSKTELHFGLNPSSPEVLTTARDQAKHTLQWHDQHFQIAATIR